MLCKSIILAAALSFYKNVFKVHFTPVSMKIVAFENSQFHTIIIKSFPGPLVSVSVDGRSISGTASGGQPLLVSLNGAQFSPLAVLSGEAILFCAKASAQLVGTVTGTFCILFLYFFLKKIYLSC